MIIIFFFFLIKLIFVFTKNQIFNLFIDMSSKYYFLNKKIREQKIR